VFFWAHSSQIKLFKTIRDSRTPENLTPKSGVVVAFFWEWDRDSLECLLFINPNRTAVDPSDTTVVYNLWRPLPMRMVTSSTPGAGQILPPLSTHLTDVLDPEPDPLEKDRDRDRAYSLS
jgi:hypothetical protein